MFMVNEAEAAAIRKAYIQHGERAAVVELRRHFPGLADNENTLICARSIAGWGELPIRDMPPPVTPPRRFVCDLPEMPKGQQCAVCGCTDDDCTDCVRRTGAPCPWIAINLCSACEPELAA